MTSYRMEERHHESRCAIGDGSIAPASRPEITKKGCEQIGDYRTEALRRSFQEAELDDSTLIGLLVLAFAADNVDVRGDGGGRSERMRIAQSLTAGDVLTADATLLRQAGRDMLVQVLNCSQRYHGSGPVARIAGDAMGADRYLPTMANADFLKCLSKAGIERTAREAGVPIMPQTGKEIRAALLRHIGESHYILPEGRFALSDTERAEQEAKAAMLADILIDAGDGLDEDGADDMPDDDFEAFEDEGRQAA